jgi:hypothetical protein
MYFIYSDGFEKNVILVSYGDIRTSATQAVDFTVSRKM